MNWQAFPLLFEMHGVTDTEAMVTYLMAIDTCKD